MQSLVRKVESECKDKKQKLDQKKEKTFVKMDSNKQSQEDR
jgi:hypothetical protein